MGEKKEEIYKEIEGLIEELRQDIPCPLRERCEYPSKSCSIKDLVYCLPILPKKRGGKCKILGCNAEILYIVNQYTQVCLSHLREIVIHDLFRDSNYSPKEREVVCRIIDRIFDLLRREEKKFLKI